MYGWPVVPVGLMVVACRHRRRRGHFAFGHSGWKDIHSSIDDVGKWLEGLFCYFRRSVLVRATPAATANVTQYAFFVLLPAANVGCCRWRFEPPGGVGWVAYEVGQSLSGEEKLSSLLFYYNCVHIISTDHLYGWERANGNFTELSMLFYNLLLFVQENCFLLCLSRLLSKMGWKCTLEESKSTLKISLCM